jgi:phosphoenolpyruvate carboxylase
MPWGDDHQNKLSADIHRLGDILGQVIRRQAGISIFELEERMRALTKARRVDEDPAIDAAIVSLLDNLSVAEIEAVARAFTIYFELVNVAEETHRVRVLRRREREAHPRPLKGSLAAAVATLWDKGFQESEMARLLDQLHIELVFTAHPTEAKRRSILSKMRRIAQALTELEVRDLLPAEEEALRNQIRAEITSLWLTERTRTAKPTVTDEVRTGLYYFDTTLWEAVPAVYAALDHALARYYPNLTPPAHFLSFGSWVGGDRDGNPNVTTEVTAETLRLHFGQAVERHRFSARELERSLSFSERLMQVSPALKDSLATTQPRASDHVAYLKERYPTELYRLYGAILADGLAMASADDVVARLRGKLDLPLPQFRSRATLVEPLNLVDASLREARAESIAATELQHFRTQARVFGLHTARLDIRQYSDDHTTVLDELLRQLDCCDNYAQCSRPERLALLSRLLAEPAPDLGRRESFAPAVQESLDLFVTLGRTIDLYGAEVLGPYIVSMTRGPEDLLAVLLLAYWTGLCLQPKGQPNATLAIAPLFETREDLKRAPDTMEGLFKHPAYARHLAALDQQQIIMIGYSDSNKDAGYLAARWGLFQAQEQLAACCRRRGILLTLFHGRGGTIARGGGPTNRAILAQPPDSMNGRIRITEQGEVIDEHYGHPAIARRHLEQVVHAMLLASAPPTQTGAALRPEWRDLLDELATMSHGAYRRLVYETPAMLTYWQQATPIREISQLRIGSRPARRTTDANLDGLRAIPWVFSWMQSRHVLPGWYGLGSALEAYATNDSALDQLQQMYRRWPFFRTLIDNGQVSLGKADMGIAGLYAGLVEDDEVRQTIFSQIVAEFQRTRRWILSVTDQHDILDNEPVLQRSIRWRNPYVDPLNFIQVSLLRQRRALPNTSSAQAGRLLQAIFLTIHGIAAGLKNTG